MRPLVSPMYLMLKLCINVYTIMPRKMGGEGCIRKILQWERGVADKAAGLAAALDTEVLYQYQYNED